jgi:hypothetical protein
MNHFVTNALMIYLMPLLFFAWSYFRLLAGLVELMRTSRESGRSGELFLSGRPKVWNFQFVSFS